MARPKRRSTPRVLETFEAEVLPGLEPLALRELRDTPGVTELEAGEGAVRFSFGGDASKLGTLRLVVAVHRLLRFAVPRPKALLGHEHLNRLLVAVAEVRRAEPFSSFRLSAPGKDSAVFKRFQDVLGRETGLTYHGDGELVVRVRRSSEGWEVLLRLSPRPLSARPWRVCNLAGGLNATLASAMLELAAAKPHERVFNPMCGSGTLLIEQALRRPPTRLVGCDLSAAALACTRTNAAEAGVTGLEGLKLDATHTGLAAGSFEVIVSDPPWGDAVGTHQDNAALYPALLKEMARLGTPQARLVLLTHEIKLFGRLLALQTDWHQVSARQVYHGGHYPMIYLLKKR